MTPEERQAALDNISPEDLAKIQAKTKTVKVGVEDVLEAEFLMNFGWSAYYAIYPEKNKDEGITANEMIRLINASRKVEAFRLYASAQTSFIAAAASQTKKPGTSFTRMSKSLKENTRVES